MAIAVLMVEIDNTVASCSEELVDRFDDVIQANRLPDESEQMRADRGDINLGVIA